MSLASAGSAVSPCSEAGLSTVWVSASFSGTPMSSGFAGGFGAAGTFAGAFAGSSAAVSVSELASGSSAAVAFDSGSFAPRSCFTGSWLWAGIHVSARTSTMDVSLIMRVSCEVPFSTQSTSYLGPGPISRNKRYSGGRLIPSPKVREIVRPVIRNTPTQTYSDISTLYTIMYIIICVCMSLIRFHHLRTPPR